MSKLPPNACRLRVRYVKDGRLAYLGHLEVMGTVMRSVRRSGVAFEVGNGFARRMRIQFSQALPVGASSEAEYFDLLLSEPIDATDALARLQQATPALLAPTAARILPRRIPALEAWANRARWEVSVRDADTSAAAFDAAVTQLQEIGSIDFLRAGKPRHLELGTTLVGWEARDVEGGFDLTLDTRSGEAGSLRPQVLVDAALGLPCARVCRHAQWHEEEDGSLTLPL